jgi:hypothetical protein
MAWEDLAGILDSARHHRDPGRGGMSERHVLQIVLPGSPDAEPQEAEAFEQVPSCDGKIYPRRQGRSNRLPVSGGLRFALAGGGDLVGLPP